MSKHRSQRDDDHLGEPEVLRDQCHTGPDAADPDVRQRLDRHHERLRAALRDALRTARALGRLPSGVDIDRTAGLLALLAYGVNLRSRAGAPAAELTRTVSDLLDSLSPHQEKG